MLEQGGRYRDKVAIVTGGASGIGLAVTRRFVSEGGAVVVGDLDERALTVVADELGDAVAVVVADVTVEADIDRLADRSVEHFGRLDVAFANAGINSVRSLVDLDLAEWSRVLAVNLTGPFLTIKHAARRMSHGGAIVVNASLSAVQPGSGQGAYCSSKAGVAMLVQVAALELGPAGIRVNGIGPGLVRTGLTEGAFHFPAVLDEFVDNTALGRHGEAEEVAAVVAFLGSDEAHYVTGSLYLVDGGAHMKRYPDMLAWQAPQPPTGGS